MGSPSPSAARGRLSYRLSLALVVPLLVAATGGAVAYQQYRASVSALRGLADGLFAEVSSGVVRQTRAFLEQAVPVSQALTEELSGGGAEPLDIGSRDALVAAMLPTLRAHADFQWLSFSTTAGSITGVYRADDGIRVWHQWIESGQSRERQYRIGPPGTGPDAWEQVEANDQSEYDPRERPFYKTAVAAGRRTWTDPYVFLPAGNPGITCATPVYGGDGAGGLDGTLRGVLTVDFDLASLSRRVAAFDPGAGGRVWIADAGGTVVAHPTARLVERAEVGDPLELRRADQIGDPLVARAWADPAVQAATRERFVLEDEAWFGGLTRFDIDGSLDWRVGVAAPEASYLGPAYAAVRHAAWLGLGALGLAALVGLGLAATVSRPLRRLAREMERIGQFELDTPPRRGSVFHEISVMDQAVTGMKHSLRSFGRFVPRDLVRSMLASGQPAELSAQSRELTVFFSDIAGFTTLAETLPPDELVSVMERYFAAMVKEVAHTGGTVDKFIGDAVMAFWNAPQAVGGHPLCGVRTALRCRAVIARMTADAGGDGASGGAMGSLHTRMGITTGPAVVGNVGTTERMNYTAMGDTVNLAARLEALNKAYGTEVLVSQAVCDACGDAVVFRPVDVVAVKGKTLGVGVYEPLAEAADATDAHGALAAACERALGFYMVRAFDRAAAAWDAALAARPGDPVATRMAARARAYAADPPPADWDGTHVMTSK